MDLWMKRVWIPFWVISLLVSLAFLGIACYDVAAAVIYDNENSDDGDYADSDPYSYYDTYSYTYLIVAGSVYIAFTVITIIFDVVQIILFARQRLSGVTAVVLNTLATTIWLVLFLCSLFVLGGGILAWVFTAVLFLCSLGMLIYSGVILGRVQQDRHNRGVYAAAATNPNAAPYTGAPQMEQQQYQQQPYAAAPSPVPATNYGGSGVIAGPSSAPQHPPIQTYYDPARVPEGPDSYQPRPAPYADQDTSYKPQTQAAAPTA